MPQGVKLSQIIMTNAPPPAASPTAAEIRAELARVLASPDFKKARRIRQFLSFIVEESLSGRIDTLKAYTIAMEVFGCGANFDPQRDPIVRVEATRLRARLDDYYATNPYSQVLISLPKGGYKPVFSYLPDRTRSAPSNASVGRRHRPAIVILPFTTLGGNEEHAPQTVQGLTEEISIGLSRFDDLAVINVPHPHTDRQYAEPAWGIADSVQARFILYGNIQIIGQAIRVRAYLVDVQTRSSLWADKFEYAFTPDELFKILDEITVQVVMAVGDSFGQINRFLAEEQADKKVSELNVHDAVLRYHHWVSTLSLERGREAMAALEHAVKLDPAYALTHGLLADVYAAHYQWGNEREAHWLDKSTTLARTALDLDANSQYAQWAWAFNLYLHGDAEQFAPLVRRAIAKNPYNTNICSAGGVKLCMLGFWEEGLELIDRSIRLNRGMPGWSRIAWVLHLYLSKNYPEALARAKLITTPDFWGGPLMRAAIYGRMDMKEQAASELSILDRICPRFKNDYRELMRRLFFQQGYVDELMHGLAAAGFDSNKDAGMKREGPKAPPGG